MEISFKGTTEEFFAAFGRQPKLFGDLPPPSPPPPPAGCCGFSENECTQLHSICAALAAADSDSFVTTYGGSLRCISHPTQLAAMVWTPNASDWVPGAWPP